MHHTIHDKAEPGDNVGFNVRGLAATDIRRGDVAGYSDSEPAFVRHDETFVGKIQIDGHPQSNRSRICSSIPRSHFTGRR